VLDTGYAGFIIGDEKQRPKRKGGSYVPPFLVD
jgi:hypothetical protein